MNCGVGMSRGFVLALGVASVCAAAAKRNDELLWRPRLPTPAIVAVDSPANRELTAEVHGPKGARDWKVEIANDLKSWDCEVVSSEFGTIDRGTDPGWQIKARVPADAPPELFSLRVSNNRNESEQRQAVSVVPKFAEDFYILHLSDEQIVNDKHTDPSGQYFRGVGTADEMVWMQEPINLIHPRFCFVTGDQIDYNGALDGWNNWHNWGYEPPNQKHFSPEETKELEVRLSKMYLDSHKGYHVPYVECPGNHDVTPADKKLKFTDILWHPISVQMYDKYFGQRSWSFRMGDFYVLQHDWTEKYLKEWAQADYAKAAADPTIKFKMMGQHWKDDQGFVPEKCDLMLVGHGHVVKTIQEKPYFIYEDGPTFRYGTSGFFNFKRTGDGWECDQTKNGERDVLKDIFMMFRDNGVVKKVRTNRGDSNAISEKSVTITNDLPEEFYDGRVRFVLEKGKYSAAKNGKILAEYDSADGKKTAVVVKVDILAKGEVTVSVE
jgi:hypothetical protein